MRQEAEHLITFTTPRSKSMPENSVALKMLRQFYQKNLLQITRCFLSIDHDTNGNKYLIIKERNPEETEIERVHVDKILDPIYRLSNDPNDRMNNLFFFKLTADSGTLSERHEIHIFQLNSISSMEFVNKLLMMQRDYRGDNTLSETITPYQETIVASTANTMHSIRKDLTIKPYDEDLSLLNRYLSEIERINSMMNNPDDRGYSTIVWAYDDISTPSTVRRKRQNKFSGHKVKWDSTKSLSNLSLNSDNRVIPVEDRKIFPREIMHEYVVRIRECLNIISKNNLIVEREGKKLCCHLFIYLRQPMMVLQGEYTKDFISSVGQPKLENQTILFIKNSIYATKNYEFWQSLGSNWTAN